MNKKSLIIGGSIVSGLIAIFLIHHIIANIGANKGASNIKMGEGARLFDKAQKLLSEGDEDGAMKNIEDLVLRYPDSPQVESAYFTLASIYEKRRGFVNAKELYQKIIETFPGSNNILKYQEALDSVNIRMLFSPIATQDSFLYEVEKGDALSKIAKKFNTTIELISKANELKDSAIKFGKKLKISKARFSIVVDKSQNILTLKADETALKTYKVSTGQSFSTPVGTFKVTTKIVDPPWYPPAGGMFPFGDPKNILGSRWMGISHPGYGIHGTTDPGSIGKNVTAGCIRLTNSDCEELYSIIPEGTEVVITD